MIDVEMADKFFDASVAVTGQAPGAFLFDRRFLMPFSRLPDAVENETGAAVTEGELHGLLEAGWFQRYEGAGEAEDELGVPLYVISRIGLFIELRDNQRYSDEELQEFAEYEDGFVETVLTTDELAYEDDDLREVIRHMEEDLSSVQMELRQSERIDNDAGIQIIGPTLTGAERAQLERRKGELEQALSRYRALHWEDLPESARLEISRFAYRVRCFNDVIRLMMIHQDRGRVKAGFGARMKIRDERFGLGVYDHGQVNWQATVYSSWFLEDPERRLRVPGGIIEGLNVTLTSSPAPSEYDRLWREHDLEEALKLTAEVRKQRICPNCLAPLTGAHPRRTYCKEACRHSAKQKRYRDRNPKAAARAQWAYWNSIPEPTEGNNAG